MRRQPGYKILIAIMVGMSLVLVQRLGGASPLRWVMDSSVTPLASVFNQAGAKTGDAFSVVTNIRNLAKENADLKRENHELQSQLAQAKEELEQLANLKTQLGFIGAEDLELLAAKVINSQPDSVRQFIAIKAGTAQGVKVGMEVISEGYLVGRITEVSPNTAKVFLVTDPNFKIGAITQRSRASGTVRGQIGVGILMEKIAQSDQVETGENVVTDSAESSNVQGVLVGKVEKVQRQDNAVFQSATLVSPINFNKLELVMVVLR